MIVKIKIDRYWLLKRLLLYITFPFAVLINFYLLGDNLFSAMAIVLIFCYIKTRLPPSPKEWKKIIKSVEINIANHKSGDDRKLVGVYECNGKAILKRIEDE